MNEEGERGAIPGQAIAIRVQSLSDLARMAGNSARLIPTPIYVFEEDGRSYYFIQTVYKDFYKLYGVPIIYYYVEEGSPPAEGYLAIKADERGERVEPSPGARPGWLLIPLVKLAERPLYFPRDR